MLEITVKTLNGQNRSFTVPDSTTVKEFKEKIAKDINIPADVQRLIFNGKILQDDKPIQEYGVNEKTIHVVERPPPMSVQGGGAAAQSNPQTAPAPPRPPGGGVGHTVGGSLFMGPFEVTGENVDLNNITNLVQSSLNSMGPLGRNAQVQASSTADGTGVNLHINLGNLPIRQRNARPQEGQTQVEVVRRMIRLGRSTLHSLERLANGSSRPTSSDNSPDEPMPQDNLDFEQDEGEGQEGEGQDDRTPELLAVAAEVVVSTVETDDVPANSAGRSSQDAENESADGAVGGQPAESSDAAMDTSDSPRGSQQGSSDRRRSSLPTNNGLYSAATLAHLMEEVNQLQQRLQPHVQDQINFLRDDPELAEDATQRVRRRQALVGEAMHYISHAQHALSDLYVHTSHAAPRRMRVLGSHGGHRRTREAVQIPVQMQIPVSIPFRGTNSAATGSQASQTRGQPQTSTVQATASSQPTATNVLRTTPPQPSTTTTGGIAAAAAALGGLPQHANITVNSSDPYLVMDMEQDGALTLNSVTAHIVQSDQPLGLDQLLGPDAGALFSRPMAGAPASSGTPAVTTATTPISTPVTSAASTTSSGGTGPSPRPTLLPTTFPMRPPRFMGMMGAPQGQNMFRVGVARSNVPSVSRPAAPAAAANSQAPRAAPVTSQASRPAAPTAAPSQAGRRINLMGQRPPHIRAHQAMSMQPGLDPTLPCRSHFLGTSRAQDEIRSITRRDAEHGAVDSLVNLLVGTVTSATQQDGHLRPAASPRNFGDAINPQAGNTQRNSSAHRLSSNSGRQSNAARQPPRPSLPPNPMDHSQAVLNQLIQNIQNRQIPSQSQSAPPPPTGGGISSGSEEGTQMLRTLVQGVTNAMANSSQQSIGSFLQTLGPEFEPAEGDGLLGQLLAVVAQHLSFNDIMQLMMLGNSQPLQRLRIPLQHFVRHHFLTDREPTQETIEAAVSRYLNEDVASEIEEFTRDTTPAYIRPEVDYEATVTTFLENNLATLVSILAHAPEGNDANFATSLMQRLRRVVHEFIILSDLCFVNGSNGFDNHVDQRLGSLMDANFVMHGFMSTSVQTQIRTMRTQVTLEPEEVQHYLVPRAQQQPAQGGGNQQTARSTSTAASSQAGDGEAEDEYMSAEEELPQSDRNPRANNPAPVINEVPVFNQAGEYLDVGSENSVARQAPAMTPAARYMARLPVNSSDSDVPIRSSGRQSSGDWHQAVPENWVPIIEQDVERQRRAERQRPFSDAYQSTTPIVKRRKLRHNGSREDNTPSGISRPQTFLLEGISQAAQAVGADLVTSQEQLSEDISRNTNLQRAFNSEVEQEIRDRCVQDSDVVPGRFPSTEKYLSKK